MAADRRANATADVPAILIILNEFECTTIKSMIEKRSDHAYKAWQGWEADVFSRNVTGCREQLKYPGPCCHMGPEMLYIFSCRYGPVDINRAFQNVSSLVVVRDCWYV